MPEAKTPRKKKAATPPAARKSPQRVAKKAPAAKSKSLKAAVSKAATRAKPAARPKRIRAVPERPGLREIAFNALAEMKAVDVKVLEVAHLTTITDTMIICTGTSNRHVKSLADSVMQAAKSNGFRPLGVEGLNEGEWVLVNLNGVLVHVMQAQTRAFYQLEKLWDIGPSGVASRNG